MGTSARSTGPRYAVASVGGRASIATTAVAMVITLGGCDSSDPASTQPSSGTEVFADGLEATLTLPTDTTSAVPLVALVPGGGFRTPNVAELPRLAEDLADRGAAVVVLDYRTSDVGEYFPVPVEDVACGFAYALESVEGLPVSQAVLGGQSAGATLASLVALAPEEYQSPSCPYEARPPDALIAFAGPYDVESEPPVNAYRFFGLPDVRDPSAYAEGNPIRFADRRPEVPVLLMHGTEDEDFPVASTEAFARALAAGGHEVTTEYPEGIGHVAVAGPDVAGPVIAEWLGLS